MEDFEFLKSFLEKEEVDFNVDLLKSFSFYAGLKIAPLCSLLGAIMSFEVIKFTGLYLPMVEFYYLDLFDCISNEMKGPELFDPTDPFYDSKTIFG